MRTAPFVRLRQVCLAAAALDPVEHQLQEILGVAPCHRANLSEFGLQNVMFAVGGSFLEVVAPTREKTAVNRFLTKTSGIGGYMAIFDCENVNRLKQNGKKLGIEVAYQRSTPAADLLQLHPRDTGVALLEFDRHQNGEDRLDAYEWAGSEWQKNLNPDVDITQFSFACRQPQDVGHRWAELMDKKLEPEGVLKLDHGQLKFKALGSGHLDYFETITLTATDPTNYLKRAENIGLEVEEKGFDLGGVRWIWQKANNAPT